MFFFPLSHNLQANINVDNDAGICGAVVSFTPTATDNCAISDLSSTPASGSTFAVGTTSVAAGAVDASSHSVTCAFTVNVNDNEAPMITCPVRARARSFAVF